MKNRQVKYRVVPDRAPAIVLEAPVWAFLFELPYFNAMNCGLIPPRECLNEFFKSGNSAEASWEPFEISTEEYAEIELQLLNPNPTLLNKYSPNTWQTFSRDHSLDQCTDFA